MFLNKSFFFNVSVDEGKDIDFQSDFDYCEFFIIKNILSKIEKI